jgi:hypothetical protein
MLPLTEIDTLFLDAGNTLVSMDFDWVARELSDLGVSADADAVRRAEAAARPSVSLLAEQMSSRNEGLFEPSMRLLPSSRGASSAPARTTGSGHG